MNVFVSWSGERSRLVADALHTFVPDVLQDVEVWMSEHKISPGARWGAELSASLEGCSFGILCLTPESLSSQWLLFEAGSIAKSVNGSRVVPFLVGLKSADVSYPLAQFQGVEATEKGALKLIRAINEARESPMPDDRLARTFAQWWPQLEAALTSIPTEAPTSSDAEVRDDSTILREILETVRRIETPNASPTSYRELIAVLQKAKEAHAERSRVLLAKKASLEREGEFVSGRWEDWSDESKWIVRKIEKALEAFEARKQ